MTEQIPTPVMSGSTQISNIYQDMTPVIPHSNEFILEKFHQAVVESLEKRIKTQCDKDDKTIEGAMKKLANTAEKRGVVRGMCYGVILASLINIASQVTVWYFKG